MPALRRPLASLGRFAAVAGCLLLAPTSRGAAADAATHGPQVLRRIEPAFPETLRQRGLPGAAEILCEIDRDGNVAGASIQQATQPEFGEAALAAVRRWKFSPALRAGQPVAGRVIVPIEFALEPEASLESIAGRPVYVPLAADAPVINAEALAAWPVPIRRAWPIYPEQLKGSGVTGSATVSFVIAPDGLPINPQIVTATHDAFG